MLRDALQVFDLASNVSEGIRNTTTVFDKPQRERVRIPRHIPHDQILTVGEGSPVESTSYSPIVV